MELFITAAVNTGFWVDDNWCTVLVVVQTTEKRL
jgi:hypothetical protein